MVACQPESPCHAFRVTLTMMLDALTLPTLIILTQREHQRLNNQVKRLQRYAPGVGDLQTYRANWAEQLGFVDRLPMLLQATDELIGRVEQGKAPEAAYDEVLFQVGIYKKGSWGLIRSLYGSPSPYVDRWLKVLPEYKHQFDRRYEADKKLTVREQGELIRALIDAAPNRGDPYGLRHTREGRALLKQLKEEDDKANAVPPSTKGKVVDLFSSKKGKK